MANNALLNRADHQNLKINLKRSAEFGDNIASIITFPTEFRDIQRVYPIFFRKDPDSEEFQALALFGFEKDENLFLDENGWDESVSYIPAIMGREPFLIGIPDQGPKEGQGKSEDIGKSLIHINMDSPRICKEGEEGEAVYLENGEHTPYLDRVGRLLETLHYGVGASKAMFEAFKKHDLLDQITLDIQLGNGEQVKLAGLYSINENTLKELKGEALSELNEKGFLQSAFMVIASLVNVQTLIERKNKKG